MFFWMHLVAAPGMSLILQISKTALVLYIFDALTGAMLDLPKEHPKSKNERHAACEHSGAKRNERHAA